MKAKDEEITYEAAMRQLEELAAKMDRGELTIDQMTTELKRAKELIAMCKKKLFATDEEIQKILAEMTE